MTIRNAIPTFGMRSVVALVVLAVAALAALLAVGSPASAQVLGSPILNATMTVGSFPTGKGYALDDVIGSLSDSTFNSGQNNHFVSLILDSQLNSGQLSIGLRSKLDDNELKSMSLYMDRSLLLHFEDAAYATEDTYGHIYTWPISPRFGWVDDQTVHVEILAEPVISIEAVTTTVEYGGNNNAAESTAEFKFTRYGSTENALSFRVTNGGIFTSGAETVTRTFTAGQSSFSNFHWAVDVDSSSNLICSIVWTLRTEVDYLVGTPNEAVVDVEGPGTTCSGGG